MAAAEVPLSHVPPGKAGVISGFKGEERYLERFHEMGLTSGTEVRVRRRAPLGGSMEVEFRGLRLGLRLQEAAMIYVRLSDNGLHQD
jgi:ferrous iron transport protein A